MPSHHAPVTGSVPASAWPGLAVGESLTGGHRNPVHAGLVGANPVVIRHSRRPEASLQWEFDLLEHLRDRGVLVPEIVPTADGLRHLDGWHVQLRIEGRHPDGSARDAAALESALRAVHSSTAGWPQRPGSRSARELLTTDRGADVDLGAVPDDLRRTIRAAWAAINPQAACVIHGDAGGGNALLLPDGRCALLDWDESRLDDPRFDLTDPSDPRQARAALAWEIATCWVAEPDYARSLVPQFLD
ncbi:phosphotransferase enzyme family protein [Ornithinimicrobium faecis]|uniref:phosphotransferase enzyme family protein n=1 Tax=Ornithinimicrobium faecis TaxID=2934158 RepID=UPI002118C60E|nr:phosphotransferase [Ornithinimicrobium sp. HY1745]